ncbi:T9SS type A sorting domain-containing protein [Chryseobacterium fluminis]|uniref:T9SS type A sorting domain-containing protein n=1 Tax=Chryseobacterium fluminis TaxID=2983606 RepID=UPI0038CC1B2B
MYYYALPVRLQIYPNPTTDFIKIKEQENASENLTYLIINSSGRVIQSGIYNDEPINVKKLNSGLYFLNLSSKLNIKVFYGKFIKN